MISCCFDGTWTDNDPRPSGQERFPKAKDSREFWTVLFHRALMQSLDPAYDNTIPSDVATYNAIVTSPGDLITSDAASDRSLNASFSESRLTRTVR